MRAAGRAGVYGLLGWGVEICFTATKAAAREPGPLRLEGRSYVWMHPVYGAGGLLLEVVHGAVARRPWWVRGAAYAAACIGLEYVAGRLLRRATGACPWDYGDRGVNVDGLARLDYAPFWAVAGLAAEPVARTLRRTRVLPPR